MIGFFGRVRRLFFVDYLEGCCTTSLQTHMFCCWAGHVVATRNCQCSALKLDEKRCGVQNTAPSSSPWPRSIGTLKLKETQFISDKSLRRKTRTLTHINTRERSMVTKSAGDCGLGSRGASFRFFDSSVLLPRRHLVETLGPVKINGFINLATHALFPVQSVETRGATAETDITCSFRFTAEWM